MDSRFEFHEILVNKLGSRNVYYQPPPSLKMSYPAIIYSRNDISGEFANNLRYRGLHSYTVTVVDSNPDSSIVERMLELPYCRFDRHYTSDNLNHDTFTIFYK